MAQGLRPAPSRDRWIRDRRAKHKLDGIPSSQLHFNKCYDATNTPAPCPQAAPPTRKGIAAANSGPFKIIRAAMPLRHCPIQNSKFKTQNSKLKTQNSKLAHPPKPCGQAPPFLNAVRLYTPIHPITLIAAGLPAEMPDNIADAHRGRRRSALGDQWCRGGRRGLLPQCPARRGF